MRQAATVPNAKEAPYRVLLYAPEDGSGYADYWFESVKDAFEIAQQHYGVEKPHWQAIPDPCPGCLHDWIAPVKIVRDSNGWPILPLQFEHL